MDEKQRARLAAFFGISPLEKDTIESFLQRMGSFELSKTKAAQARILINQGTFFADAPAQVSTETEFDRVAARILEDVYFGADKGVQQQWFTSEADAFNEAALAAGYTDPAKLTDAGKRIVREKFNIYAQAGRFTYSSRAATATGDYETEIVGTGPGRTVVLTQGGRYVTSSRLGPALDQYTSKDLNVVYKPIPDQDEQIVIVQDTQGKVIAQ